ncbi:MAG TPA: type II toxin-antitoxin system VapC family toxin [Euzebyales bacterium]
MSGPMLVVDAGPLFEVVADTARAEPVRVLMAADDDLAAPHLVDAEVLAVIQTQHRRGRLDDSAAAQAVTDLQSWPAQRWSHPSAAAAGMGAARQRSWLRRVIRRLAEWLAATLVTADARLVQATGPRCGMVLVGAGGDEPAG